MAFILSYGKNGIDANKVEENSSTLKNIHINDSIFVSYNDEPNTVVFRFKGLLGIPGIDYKHDSTSIPDPLLGNEINQNLKFYSKYPGYCNVTWDDGVKETYPFVRDKSTGFYKIIFRGLDIEYRKNPNSHPWWFRKEDGNEYIPVSPHVYTDGDKEKIRTVVFEFTNKIDAIYTDRSTPYSFPVLNMPDLRVLVSSMYEAEEFDIPFDRIGRSTNIEQLEINANGRPFDRLPEALLLLTKLKRLSIYRMVNFSDTENSGLRDIAKLKNLEHLNIADSYVRVYPREFLNLTKMHTLEMDPSASNASIDYVQGESPSFEEVEQISPSLRSIRFMGSWYGGNDKSWHEGIQGKGLENLTSFTFSDCTPPLDYFPEYIKEMRGLQSFGGFHIVTTQDRANQFVDTFYDYVTNWEHITMSGTAGDGNRNQFYNLRVSIYASSYPQDYRPAGVEQAPAGFVLGSSNGTPQTPMEKIYVLKNNYKQIWIIKPE